jgi:hypothetical protein
MALRRRLMTLCVGVAALVTLAFGGVTLASAGKPSKPKPVAAAPTQPKSAPDTGEAATEPSPENNEGAIPDGDAAAQDAACKAAGIDPAADNVQYDPSTGCSLDNGADSGN